MQGTKNECRFQVRDVVVRFRGAIGCRIGSESRDQPAVAGRQANHTLVGVPRVDKLARFGSSIGGCPAASFCQSEMSYGGGSRMVIVHRIED